MDWAAIPENPDDEYDCLVDHIVSALHRGADVSALAELIEVGFQDHFGLPVDREAAVSVAQTIGHWWERNRAS